MAPPISSESAEPVHDRISWILALAMSVFVACAPDLPFSVALYQNDRCPTGVVTFEDFPGNAETSTRLLEARPKRSHASTIPGRFSWTIQRLLHGPLRGPVGSSIR